MIKPFLQHIGVVLCKKRLDKTANIRKIRPFLKLPKMANKQRLKPLQNRHFRSKIKNGKKGKTVSTTHCSCSMQKNGEKKRANIRKMRPF